MQTIQLEVDDSLGDFGLYGRCETRKNLETIT